MLGVVKIKVVVYIKMKNTEDLNDLEIISNNLEFRSCNYKILTPVKDVNYKIIIVKETFFILEVLLTLDVSKSYYNKISNLELLKPDILITANGLSLDWDIVKIENNLYWYKLFK